MDFGLIQTTETSKDFRLSDDRINNYIYEVDIGLNLRRTVVHEHVTDCTCVAVMGVG